MISASVTSSVGELTTSVIGIGIESLTSTVSFFGRDFFAAGFLAAGFLVGGFLVGDFLRRSAVSPSATASSFFFIAAFVPRPWNHRQGAQNLPPRSPPRTVGNRAGAHGV